MLPYFIPPFIALLGAIIYNRLTLDSRRIMYVITTITAIFFYCCVYMNGADWPGYELVFNEITWKNIDLISSKSHFEIGFCFLMLCFKTIGFSFFPFLIISKSFSLIVISNFLKKYAQKNGENESTNVFLLLLVFYLGNCMYLYVETIIRFSIALAIVVIAYKFLLKRRLFSYLLLISLAMTFHKSAIIMFPLYFLRKTYFSSKIWVFIFISIIVLLSPEILLNAVYSLNAYIPPLYFIYLKGYLEYAFIRGTNILSVGNLVYMFFLCICLFYRRKFVSSFKDGEQLYLYLLIYFIIYYVTVYAGSIGRLSLYLRPVFIVVFISILSLIKFYKKLFICFFILFLAIGMGDNILEKKSFLPYTNYIISKLKGESLPFHERRQVSDKDE